jgi:hypothetical protein
VSPAPFSCIAQRSPFLFSTSPKLIASAGNTLDR